MDPKHRIAQCPSVENRYKLTADLEVQEGLGWHENNGGSFYAWGEGSSLTSGIIVTALARRQGSAGVMLLVTAQRFGTRWYGWVAMTDLEGVA
jgi:hypothetical protein